VLALDRQGQWQEAEVVGVRKDDLSIEDDEEEATKDCEPLKHHKRSFEYFISYVGLEKNNDRWVRDTMIKEKEEINKVDDNAIQDFLQETKLKSVEFLQYDNTLIETWYYSPLPQKYHNHVLYACDFCLEFCTTKLENHHICK